MTKTLEPPKEGVVTLIEGINMASLTEKFCVKAMNNDITSFAEVIRVLVSICDYSVRDASSYAKKIHDEGFAICFWGNKEKCQNLIKAFSDIKVIAYLLEN